MNHVSLPGCMCNIPGVVIEIGAASRVSGVASSTSGPRN